MPASSPREGPPIHAAAAFFGVVFTFVGFLAGILIGLTGIWVLLFGIGFGIAAGVVVDHIVRGVPEGTAAFVLRIIWPSGDSTPYAKVYSREQSLAARGDVEGAMEAYEDAMRLNPADPEPRFQAAELQFRSDPAWAIALFVEARRLAATDRARELYATQRLIDLYLGPAKQPQRALVELRRLTDRFPGTREARAASDAIRKLREEGVGKQERGAE